MLNSLVMILPGVIHYIYITFVLGEQMAEKDIHDRDVEMLQQSDGMHHYVVYVYIATILTSTLA